MCSAMHTDWVDILGGTVHPHDASGQATQTKNTVHVCVTNRPSVVLHLQLSQTQWKLFKETIRKWMKNKVNTMHVLELAIGFTSNYETVN